MISWNRRGCARSKKYLQTKALFRMSSFGRRGNIWSQRSGKSGSGLIAVEACGTNSTGKLEDRTTEALYLPSAWTSRMVLGFRRLPLWMGNTWTSFHMLRKILEHNWRVHFGVMGYSDEYGNQEFKVRKVAQNLKELSPNENIKNKSERVTIA